MARGGAKARAIVSHGVSITGHRPRLSAWQANKPDGNALPRAMLTTSKPSVLSTPANANVPTYWHVPRRYTLNWLLPWLETSR